MMNAALPGAPPRISIILPALDEEAALPAVLLSLRQQENAPEFEVILADGGSGDRTIERFVEHTLNWPAPCAGALVVRSPRRGRAAQMNAGAGVARGSALLFLHADTLLPTGALAAIDRVLLDSRVVGGGFRHRFRESHPLLGLISFWSTARARLHRVHYGDQAMFLRRDVFQRIGGFADLPLFEDLRLAQALKRQGRVRTLPLAVGTSARRLIDGGILRTGLWFAWLRLRFALGADPTTLRRGYRDVR